MGNERRSVIAEEEIEENDLIEDKNDFLYSDEDYEDDEYFEDDEPEEREYCD
jgi:hypothetical protein